VKIIQPSFEILTKINGEEILKLIELAGRVCYKSEDKINEESAEKFVKSIINRGHLSVIEHASISVRIICDRGVSHELVRHRLASYSQESTRYCNYSQEKFGNELTFIDPSHSFGWKNKEGEVLTNIYKIWKEAMLNAETSYFLYLSHNATTSEEARSILPNSIKTELIMTCNLREWHHFFKLRCSSKAHPQMRQITIPMLSKFRELIPFIFDDIEV